MKSRAAMTKKMDPKVWVLAAVLGLALLGVGISWRMSHPSATGKTGAESVLAPASIVQLSREASRLADVVEERLREDAKTIATDWPEVKGPAVAVRVVAQETAMTFRLRGVIRGGKQPLAFLNDKTVAVGEEIDGFSLVAIADDHVILKDSEGKKHELYQESGP